jgi:hypothetical protein
MRRGLVVLVVLLLTHLHLLGQTTVTSGHTVRITSSRHEMQAEVGRVLAASADTIVVQVQGIRTVNHRQVYRTDTLALPLAAIERLEVSRHSGHRTGRGAVVGLGIGAAAGLIIGTTTYQPCPADNLCIMAPTSAVQQGIEGAAVFGFIGAVAGALIGSTIRADKWENISMRAALLRPLPYNQVGLGITAAF